MEIMVFKFKKIVREIINKLFDHSHFGASSDRLRVLEEDTYRAEGDLFSVPFKYIGFGHYDTISPSQVVGEIRLLENILPTITNC